jgi:BMFP domain-containing protein YqiC
MMPVFDLKRLEAAAERIASLLPADPRALREEIRDTLRPLLEAALARMDLVTREEFDAQVMVLRRTREKLEALEREMEALEGERSGD